MAHRPPVVVIGAGIAGLTAAAALRRQRIPVRLFEAGREVAGLAASFVDQDGFSYDFGAHFITNRLAAALGVGTACRDVRYYGESVFLKGKTYSYPFGLAASPRFALSAIARRGRQIVRRQPAVTAAEWFSDMYGELLAREVAIPLVEAWSGAPADRLAASVGNKFGYGIGHTMFLKLATRVLGKAVASGYCNEQPESIHVWHVYPMGGVALLCRKLAESLEEVLQLESPVQKILVEDERVVGVRVHGQEIEASAVVSTAPVHILPRLVEGSQSLQHLARFRYRPMIFVNLRLTGRNLMSDVVTWTPEAEFPFFRITEAPQSMPWLAPAGKTMLTIDIGCEQQDPLWTMGDGELGELCLRHLQPLLPDVRERYLGCQVLRTPIAYPIYLQEYEAERLKLQQSTGVAGLHSIGRNGEFAHILMEDVYWRTLRRVRQVVAGLSAPRPAVAEA
ncbi:MAG TPA: FAD-dependent oxidoreductase [Gemmatimonadales bacterium]|jgi:protoporphyrinogen oxidase